MDYVAKAREASRRWREAQGLPLRVDLLSVPSFPSSLSKKEGIAQQGEERFAREFSTTETIETTVEREKKGREAQESKAGARVSRYAHPWPDEIPGLGRRHIEAYDRCANCETGTWAFYGPWPLCLRCASLGKIQ